MYQNLGRNQANYTALSPLSFLRKAATVHPQRVAVITGSAAWTGRRSTNAAVGWLRPCSVWVSVKAIRLLRCCPTLQR